MVRRIILISSVCVGLWMAVGCETVPGPESSGGVEQGGPVVAPGVAATKLAGDFRFTEGPAADADGNVYFTDIPNNRILKWSTDGKLSVYKVKTGGANGLFFDAAGNLVACAGGNRMVVMYPADGGTTRVLADGYEGRRFNSPNDLWIDPQGGIYFTDPRYGNRDGMEMGEHVYYIRPGGAGIVRVIDDMTRPNGIIGTPDGKTLYVADHGGQKIWRYRIRSDGSLTDKRLFAQIDCDGMTLDERGNVYVTSDAVVVYRQDGTELARIKVPEKPANVCFGGPEHMTLFITARTSLYAVPMLVRGAY